jgi:uncharacterized membrane protein
MNWAHVHLVLNHVPVLGTFFGLALLGYALIRRSDPLKRAALNAFVAIALLALPVYFTGEPAEEVVEHAAGVAKDRVESHEDAALLALTAVELLGVVAALGLYASRRARPISAKATGAALIVALAAATLMARAANLGGQIHHTEIRSGVQPPAPGDGTDEER